VPGKKLRTRREGTALTEKGTHYKDSMPWYHWVAAYSMIISGAIFWTVPEKPIWLMLLLVAAGVGGVLAIGYLPLEKKNIEPPK
jgi:hypothetical protein